MKCEIFRGPPSARMHLRLKCTFECSKCEPGRCFFHTNTDRGAAYCVFSMAVGYEHVVTCLHQESHAHKPTHEKPFKHAEAHRSQSEQSSEKTIK